MTVTDNRRAAQQVASVKRQAGRTWVWFILLAAGLWLIKDDTVQVFNYQRLPAALGALGIGSWLMRMTLFKDRADASGWPGILLSATILLSVALVVAGVVG